MGTEPRSDEQDLVAVRPTTIVLADRERDAFLRLLDRPAMDKPRLRALLAGPPVLDQK